MPVEICNPDGEWSSAETVGSHSSERRTTSVRVRLSGGKEENVSLGMLIVPSKDGKVDPQDLSRCRGRSSEELFAKYQDQQKDSAVASGKDYCKSSGQHTMRVGGVPFVAGIKRKDMEKEEDFDEESRIRDRERQSGPSMEHRAKMAAIEQKYCARVVSSQSKNNNDGADRAERLRFG